MFTIRQNTFETNSSSSHSLVITNKENGRYTPEEARKELHWVKDGWWEPWEDLYFGRAPFQVLSTFEAKLRYAYAHAPLRKRPSKRHPEWENYSRMYWVISNKVKKLIPDFKGIKLNSRRSVGTDDYALWGWLKKANITLEEFLMNKNIVVICDGDEYCIWTDMKALGLISKDNIKLAIPEKEWWEKDD